MWSTTCSRWCPITPCPAARGGQGRLPAPYPAILAAWREIVPAVLRQVKDPSYHVKRGVPPRPRGGRRASPDGGTGRTPRAGSRSARAGALAPLDIVRLDLGHRTFAVYRDAAGSLFATDGICTHGNTHLADGLVKEGIIECPKHNGRFHLRDGSPARPPVCAGSPPIRWTSGTAWSSERRQAGRGRGAPPEGDRAARRARPQRRHLHQGAGARARRGPARSLRATTCSSTSRLTPPSASGTSTSRIRTGRRGSGSDVLDLVARNPRPGRRNNYSLASNPRLERTFRLNVRIATPPPGQDCPPGAGSS